MKNFSLTHITMKRDLRSRGVITTAVGMAENTKITEDGVVFPECVALSNDCEDLVSAKILALGIKWKSAKSCAERNLLSADARDAKSAIIQCVLEILECSSIYNLHLAMKLLVRIIDSYDGVDSCKFTAGITSICKRFGSYGELQGDIRHLLEKLKICIPEHHLYSVSCLKETNNPQMLEGLMGTINSNIFKKTKKVLKDLPYEDYLDHFPVLSELGILNYRELANGNIFKDGILSGSLHHPFETVRVEFLKTLNDAGSIEQFLRFNQMMEDKQNQETALAHVIKTAKVTPEIERMCISMCKSRNLLRRHFGTLILAKTGILESMLKTDNQCRCMIETDNDQGMRNLFLNLAMDSCMEIRELISAHIDQDLLKQFKVSREFVIDKLETGKSYIIEGISKFVDEKMLGEFEKEMDDIFISNSPGGKGICDSVIGSHISESGFDNSLASSRLKESKEQSKRFIGVLHCLIMHSTDAEPDNDKEKDTLEDQRRAKYISEDRIRLLYQWGLKNENWMVIKECCTFYHLQRKPDSLMRILLHSDHLGVISRIKAYLEPERLCLEPYLREGLQALQEKEINSRKSGGLSLYFVLLARDPKSYAIIRNELLELIQTGKEHIMIHCLNIFRGILDATGNDEAFFLSLSLDVLDHPSYNIKNCGFGIFSAVSKKILAKTTFSAFLAVHKEIDLLGHLKLALDRDDRVSAYLILFVYEKLDFIPPGAKLEIARCLEYSDFMQLKARQILSGEPSWVPEDVPETLNVESKGLAEVLCTYLAIMNTANSVKKSLVKEDCRRRFGWGVCSDEYTRYLISKQAAAGNVLPELRTFVERMRSLTDGNEDSEFNFYESADWEYDLNNITEISGQYRGCAAAD